MSEAKTVRQVRIFIGPIGYFRRVVPIFSRLVTPQEVYKILVDG